MRQPISTITNIAFLVPAILATEWYVSMAFILLMFGSAAFHSIPRTQDWARHFDEIGMLAVFWSLLASLSSPIGGYIALAGFAGTAVKFKHFDSYEWVPILFIVTLMAKADQVGAEALYVLIPFGLALAATGLAARYPEGSTIHDVLHGGWHLLAAIGFVGFISL